MNSSSNLLEEAKNVCLADSSDGGQAEYVQQESSQSAILDFYHNRSVLITGGSGFLGKVLIEKLLRVCTNIRQIFVLIRPKLNRKPHERLEELLSSQLFDGVRELGIDVKQKVVVLEGDVTEPHLGLSAENLLRVIHEVSVIYHSAATLKFDEPLKLAVAINLAGIKNMIQVCRKIPQLAALVHVSTAYANCDKEEIDEHIYPVGELDPEDLIEMANWLDQDTLQELKIKLLDAKPNTYTYTKALGEWLLAKSGRDLPIVICRPSIVVASHREPFSGWIEGLNGPTGVILGIGKGLLRTMLVDNSKVADFVPVDMVINLVITLGWFAHAYKNQKLPIKMNGVPPGSDLADTADRCGLNDGHRLKLPSMSNIVNQSQANEKTSADTSIRNVMTNSDTSDHNLKTKNEESQSLATQLGLAEHKSAKLESKLRQFRHNVQVKLAAKNLPEVLADIPVFHCTSGVENTVTYKQVQVSWIDGLTEFPSSDIYRYPVGIFTTSKLQHKFVHVTSHLMPAYVADFIANLMGNRATFARVVRKYEQATNALTSFTLTEWKFSPDNRLMLYNEMLSDEDRKLFGCDLTSISWPDFLNQYVLGVRRFILKESDDSLNQARLNMRYVYYRNSAVQILFIAMIAYYLFAC